MCFESGMVTVFWKGNFTNGDVFVFLLAFSLSVKILELHAVFYLINCYIAHVLQ